jgi:hypothetical protein
VLHYTLARLTSGACPTRIDGEQTFKRARKGVEGIGARASGAFRLALLAFAASRKTNKPE